MWDRWKQGDSLQMIARLFDRNHSSIQHILAKTAAYGQHTLEDNTHYWAYRELLPGGDEDAEPRWYLRGCSGKPPFRLTLLPRSVDDFIVMSY